MTQTCAVRDLKNIIVNSHVSQRLQERGGEQRRVRDRVRQAHSLLQGNPDLAGSALGLVGEDPTIVVQFQRGGAVGLLVTLLEPQMALKPGTVAVEV